MSHVWLDMGRHNTRQPLQPQPPKKLMIGDENTRLSRQFYSCFISTFIYFTKASEYRIVNINLINQSPVYIYPVTQYAVITLSSTSVCL